MTFRCSANRTEVWVKVCMGDTQYARQIIGPDYHEQNEEDEAPVLHFTNHLTRVAGRDVAQKAGGDPTQKPKSKPKQKPKQAPRSPWPYEVDRGLNIDIGAEELDFFCAQQLEIAKREDNINIFCVVTSQKN